MLSIHLINTFTENLVPGTILDIVIILVNRPDSSFCPQGAYDLVKIYGKK